MRDRIMSTREQPHMHKTLLLLLLFAFGLSLIVNGCGTLLYVMR
jgi:hypothetical protein